MLESCWQAEAAGIPFEEWLGQEKRMLLHAGGQGRRLSAYAPSGKVLTPIPVFRWARGQRLSQDLLSLQLPLYRQILAKAPASLHTLVASGDVYIRCNEPLQKIPEADVVCYGLWVDPNLATNHGVFVSRRETPGVLDFMLQKPSLKELGQLSETHLFLMDIGIWLLSDRAVRLLAKHSKREDRKAWNFYDLYDLMYRMKYGTEAPYPYAYTGAEYEIPASEFDSVLQSYLNISSDTIRSRTVYDPGSDTYQYRPRGLEDSEYSYPPYPEVTAYEIQADGTVKLTVQAVYITKFSDQAVTSELVVRPLPDGSFQYVSNHVTGTTEGISGSWYTPRLTEEEWNDRYR